MTVLEQPLISESEAARWISGLAAFDGQNELVLLSLFTTFGIPQTYLDVGSGTGAMVNIARKLGVDAYGVDILPRPAWPHLLQRDLREPLYMGRVFDIVTSFETAEHIEPDYADVLVGSIARHVKAGGLLIFSAAMPGQQGDGHVHLRQAVYWREQFDKRGLTYRPDITYKLALGMSLARHALHHLEANLQVFSRHQSNA